MLGTCSPLPLHSLDCRNSPYPWQKAAIRSLNTIPQNSYKFKPSYEIPTCQQLHIGYSFTFCSSDTSFCLWGRSKSQGMDYTLNLLITKWIWSHVIWQIPFLQTSNQGKKSEKCLMFSVKRYLKPPLSCCHHANVTNITFYRILLPRVTIITYSARFKVPSCQIHEAGWAEESTEIVAKVLSYTCICSLGSLHSLVMLYLSHILFSATTDMSHAWSFLVSKNVTTTDFKPIANYSEVSLKIL